MDTRRSTITALSCAVLLFGVTRARAQGRWAPPTRPGNVYAPATVTEEWVRSLQVGSTRIVLTHTPLDSVRRWLRTRSISQGRVAGSFQEWLCVSGGNGDDRWVLWLESGEMGAGAVEAFHLVSIPAGANVDRRCQRLSPTTTLTIPKQIALGMPDDVLRTVLGPPSAVVADTLIYEYEQKMSANTLVLVLERGRVVQIAVSIGPL
jgi:hypothetical protein